MLYINLNKEDSSLSLTKQIYNFFINAIMKGILKQDEKLPSTRELSKYLKVSRNVVIESYEQLIAEGYLYTKNGSGTYVSRGIIFEPKTLNKDICVKEKIKNKIPDDYISFRTGVPDLSAIPIKKWGQIYKKITLSVLEEDMGYKDSSGEYELRYELANYLKRVRGVKTNPENIIITNGAAQVFSLLSELVNKDEYALVENPLSYGILNTLKNKNVKITPISVDEFGMMTDNLPSIAPKLIFTTPSHQFPTGVILPINRRIEMIKYARKHHAYIVEDDYDSEFRFDVGPIQSMQALDSEHVIYVGTFSKIFMPALRMGYMILPNSLCEEMKKSKYIDDLHSPILEQLTMAQFISEGLLDIHIKKMRDIYLKRRNVLIKSLKECFKDRVYISGAQAGMHLVASFKDIVFDDPLLKKIRDNNLEVTPLRRHYIDAEEDININYNNSLILGYGNTNIEKIQMGIQRLYLLIR